MRRLTEGVRRYSSPGRHVYLTPGETEAVTARLSSLLSELAVSDSPVIIHCMGHAGLSLYTRLRQASVECRV